MHIQISVLAALLFVTMLVKLDKIDQPNQVV